MICLVTVTKGSLYVQASCDNLEVLISREELVLVVLQFITYYYFFDLCYLLLCTEG